MNQWSPSGPDANRRRSQRVMLSLPVTVSGKAADGPFTEATHTMVINAHGALVGLKARVVTGQTVRIKTPTSADEQECQVIWIGPTAEGRTQCGLEFTQPSPKFWGVSFPPADWSPSAAPAMAGSRKK
jgi:PilZ domain